MHLYRSQVCTKPSSSEPSAELSSEPSAEPSSEPSAKPSSEPSAKPSSQQSSSTSSKTLGHETQNKAKWAHRSWGDHQGHWALWTHCASLRHSAASQLLCCIDISSSPLPVRFRCGFDFDRLDLDSVFISTNLFIFKELLICLCKIPVHADIFS